MQVCKELWEELTILVYKLPNGDVQFLFGYSAADLSLRASKTERRSAVKTKTIIISMTALANTCRFQHLNQTLRMGTSW